MSHLKLSSGRKSCVVLLMADNIKIKNIYYMLSYAYQTLNEAGFESVSSESFDNVHDLLAAILSRGVSNQVTSIISGNLYQIFTYVKNKDKLGTGNVSGVLLYAKTVEELTPDNDYCIGGNSFGVKTLDLNTDWCEIKSQLDLLPEYYLS